MKKLSVLPALLLLLPLVGCKSQEKKLTIDDLVFDDTYYSKITERVAYDSDTSLNIDEDFSGGLDASLWYALDGAWHNTVSGYEHGGVQSRNLSYIREGDETYLALKGKGMYFDENATPEGACILSRNNLGTGRYEIRMKVLPREGAVSTMWTYATATGNEATSQNEIDIEIGATADDGTHYKHGMYTSWTTHSNTLSQKIDNSSYFYFNDGEFHTYTFDWYTNFLNTGFGRIDWFVDGHYLCSVYEEDAAVIPTTNMPLWIGVWFPPAWPGDPAFEEDYMIVDSVSYTAFDIASQYYTNKNYNAPYTKNNPDDLDIPTLTETPVVNKLSNGSFEKTATNRRDHSYFGWKEDSSSKGTLSFDSLAKEGASALKLTAGEETADAEYGEYVFQRITDAYENFGYELSVDARLLDDESRGNIEIFYYQSNGRLISSEKISVESTTYATYTKALTMPKNSYELRIYLTSENGSVLYDNASLLYRGLQH